MAIVFDKNLETGNSLIDTQHQELIARVNKLTDSLENGKKKNVAIQTLAFLMDYTEFHFKAEEQLQEEIGYPGIKEHKAKHEELRRTVSELHEMLEEQEGPTDDFVEMVNKNVTEWLYYHIKGFDRSVAEYKFIRNNEKMI